MKFNRRNFLQLIGASSVAAVGGVYVGTRASEAPITGGDSEKRLRTANPDFNPDIELILRASPDTQQILEGQATTVWRYRGEVVSGDPSALQAIPNSYLGPTIQARTGQKLRIRFQNELPEASNVHWHGLYVPDHADGHPRFIAHHGEEYVYEFEVKNRAGTYWYHPHPHGRTGAQVINGLAGLFIIKDEIEDALSLPSGNYDLPLVIQDRRFDADNQLVYVQHMHDRMMGFVGDTILVNGQINARQSVATRPYRLRLLNGCNSRILMLAWQDETPLRVIGTDGGLIEQAVTKPYITLGPAERAELWIDFSDYQPGTELTLIDVSTGRPLDIMTFSIDEVSDVRLETPTSLRPLEKLDIQQAVNAENPRRFEFSMAQGMPRINRRVFEMEAVAADEVVQLGDTEIWEFHNDAGSGGMMMPMPHPIHMHGRQFQIIERSIDPRLERDWAAVRAGYLDNGWKDTFLLMPGETAKVAVMFDDYPGLFIYHCHTLEHEDMGMMRNYEVRT